MLKKRSNSGYFKQVSEREGIIINNEKLLINTKMRKIGIITLILMCVIVMPSCKKRVTEEQNSIKVSIAFDDAEKNQKIYIHSGSEAAIYWTPGSQIRLMSTSNNYLLIYTGMANNLANFQLAGGSDIATGNYIGFYPASATASAYNNITFTAPNYYNINPQAGKKDEYIIDNLLMYTKTKYTHGSNDTVFFTPAMTILEIPIATDSGYFYINNIELKAVGPSEWWGQAFIKKGKLPNVLANETTLTGLEFSNTLHYNFIGQALQIGTTPDTLKLLVWSNGTETQNLQKYTININNGLVTKSITRTNAFLNSKYYKLPCIQIADTIVNKPIQIGDAHQGGIVFYILQTGDNGYVAGETHGLVCAPTILGPMAWSNATYTYCTTSTALGSGANNTQLILNKLGSNAYAAYACDTCSQNGFTDWFLPSSQELILLNSNISHFSNYIPLSHPTNSAYWTSSEPSEWQPQDAYVVRIPTGNSHSNARTNNEYVIPVRKF